ncbi:MAG: 3-demethylubiquinone-9 3-O-methyltransferase [Candidatus Zixiibacteriota bacterium]|nr:MAG: 3-demethylubiquinone-9 3-O-methyltransferase [candidate division Zixibacteria bacterium]
MRPLDSREVPLKKLLSLFTFRLPAALKDTRRLDERTRYDRMSGMIPDFVLSDSNPLVWQNRLRHPYFRTKMGEIRGRSVLEAGCGWGFLARNFADDGARVTALDPSPVTLDLARRHHRTATVPIRFVQGVAEHLPFPEASFDLVTATDMLEHVADLDACLAEFARVLKPGGRFGFVTVNRTWIARLIYITMGENVLGMLPRGTHRYDKFIPPDDLSARLRRLGLVTEEIRGILVNPLLLRYHFWLSKSIEYIGVAKK